MSSTTQEKQTTPSDVLTESVIIFGLILMVKYLNKYFKESKSILPFAIVVALGYYIIMYIVSRVRPCMCTNIRNALTWSAGMQLGKF